MSEDFDDDDQEYINEHNDSHSKAFYEAEDCTCGEHSSNMEWDIDQECYICPNCGEVQ